MARPSVIPVVRQRLEAYLEQCETAYLEQPESTRSATLPRTGDGKVNVRAVAQAIDLKPTQEKYLYERDELTSLINLVAEGQGLLPIGSRLVQDASDKAIKERLARQAQTARADAQAAVEATAVQDELLEKVRELSLDNERLSAENLRLRAMLDAMDQGLHIRIYG
ncbi:MAG: hypothetical protein JF607_01195 [Burkholderiales bacterium]|nr:hypothetical protein [Burkholderiales bacterium]